MHFITARHNVAKEPEIEIFASPAFVKFNFFYPTLEQNRELP